MLPLALLDAVAEERRPIQRQLLERLFGGTIPEVPFEGVLGPVRPMPWTRQRATDLFQVGLRHWNLTESLGVDGLGIVEVIAPPPEEVSGAQCEDLAERMESRVGHPLTRWIAVFSSVDSNLRGITVGFRLYRAAVAEVSRRGGLLLPDSCHDLGSTSGMAEAVWQRLANDPTLWIERGTLRRSRPGTVWPIAAFDPVAAGLVPASG